MDTIQVIITSCLQDEISTVSVWDVHNGTLLARYRGGGFCSPHGLCTSGGYILSCQDGKPMLHLWQFNKQHCENKRLLAPGKINTVAYSPDSLHIALSVDEKIHLYQTSSGRLLGIGSRHFQPVTVIKFSDDSTLLCCGGKDGLVTVWSLSVLCSNDKTPEPIHTFSDHTLPISDLVITSGNIRSRVISVSADRTCKVCDLVAGKVLLSVVFEARLCSVSISPVELELYVGDLDGGIHEFSLRNPPRMLEYHVSATEKKSGFYSHSKTVNCLVCTIDCCNLISGSDDGTIKVWHINSRQCLRTIPQKGPVTNIVCMLLSKSVFSHEFKPSEFINDFINPANVDEDEEATFDILTSKDLLTPPSMTSNRLLEYSQSSEATNAQIKKLKDINHAIYHYAINHILQKKPVENNPSKRPQKKKRKKI